jgi:hypothetical protein
MLALKARFDGRKVVLPKGRIKARPGMVIIIFEEATDSAKEKLSWIKAQEKTFAKAWNNTEDAAYDSL